MLKISTCVLACLVAIAQTTTANAFSPAGTSSRQVAFFGLFEDKSSPWAENLVQSARVSSTGRVVPTGKVKAKSDITQVSMQITFNGLNPFPPLGYFPSFKTRDFNLSQYFRLDANLFEYSGDYNVAVKVATKGKPELTTVGSFKVTKSFVLSDSGANFIKRHEIDLRIDYHVPYNDNKGYCTIGIGHLLHRSPCNGNDPSEKPYKGRRLSEPEVLALLRTDVAAAEKDVQQQITVSIKQNQFDALVDFRFNVGHGDPNNPKGRPGFTYSTLKTLVNTRRFSEVPAEFMKWTASGAPGERVRRQDEGKLFSSGTY
ncbi:MAG TPA: lysozyme [Symbiobacteriaceae bacterium]